MTEFTDLTTLYGAIDEAVVDDPGLTPKVAPLLPAYAGGAAGWYRGLALQIPAIKASVERSADERSADERSADGRESGELDAAPDTESAGALITPALEGLAGLEDQQPGADEYAGRLLLAIAVLSRIWPSPSEADSPLAQQLDGLSLDKLVAALKPVTVGNDEVRARRLLALLADEEGFCGVSEWDSLLGTAVQQNLLPPAVAALSVAPCAWTVVPVTSAGGPAVAFETRHRVLGVTQGDFDDLLDPSKWVTVRPPWCEMGLKPASDPEEYLEILSAACPAGSPISLTTPLDFVARGLLDGSGHSLEYRLSQDPTSEGGDGVVSVDEGSLVVRESQGAVQLITTKRIQFTALKSMPPIEAAWLAQLVWVLGYQLLAEYFVNKVTGGTGAVVTTSTYPAPAKGLCSWSPSAAPLGSAVSRRLSECVDGFESSWTKVRKGGYGTEAYVKDLVTLADHAAGYTIDLLRFWAGAGTTGGWTSSTGNEGPLGSDTCVSEIFDLPAPSGPGASQPRTLVLDPTVLEPGLLRFTSDRIAATAVRFVPPVLRPGQTSFKMVLDRKRLDVQPGGTYTGTVRAQVAGGQTDGTCAVWIVVS
jgi:hypothetical protein